MIVGIAVTTHWVTYYFSWNPVGAIRAGRNPATYKYCGETVHIDGKLLINWEYKFQESNKKYIFSIPFFVLRVLTCFCNMYACKEFSKFDLRRSLA